MTGKFALGNRWVGYLQGLGAEPFPALAEIDEDGVLVTVPRESSQHHLLDEFHCQDLPKSLCFLTADGPIELLAPRMSQAKVMFGGNGFSTSTIRASSAIWISDSCSDHSQIQGMESKIEGLARWASMSPVSERFDFSVPRYPAIVIRGQNLPPRILGGPLNARLETSFMRTDPNGGETHQIIETLSLETRSVMQETFLRHRRVHILFQDLMCLVYGAPVNAELISVIRSGDEEADLVRLGKLAWSPIYDPDYGRGAWKPMKPTENPLFLLSDCGAQELSHWLYDWDRWSRATSIMVSSMYTVGATVESRLLHAAVALEALGYSVLLSPGKRPSTLNFEGALNAVFNCVRWDWRSVLGEKSSAWVRRLRTAYNGVKHADTTMPDPSEAFDLAKQAFTVMRLWQAHTLGVPEDIAVVNLQR